MDAVWLEVPESFLAERQRLGHDKKDEVWDGVLHMVPPPSTVHDRLTCDLGIALDAIAKRRGQRAWIATAGVFQRGVNNNYRIPDVTIARPDQVSHRGLEGAELVVEVMSPRDESRSKFEFYALVGVREIWLIDPSTRATEIYQLAGGRYLPIAFDAAPVISPVLGISLEIINGPLLRLRDGAETYDV